jgi:hypothetical protein
MTMFGASGAHDLTTAQALQGERRPTPQQSSRVVAWSAVPRDWDGLLVEGIGTFRKSRDR